MSEEQVNITVNGGAVDIRHGMLPDLPDIFSYRGFKYNTTSAEGFIDLVRAKGSQDNGVIFWGKDGSMWMICDDTVKDRPQDAIYFTPALTVEFGEWKGILTAGKKFDHKQFIDFLRRRPAGEIEGCEELLAKVRKFTYVNKSEGEAIRKDNNNYAYSLKVNNAEFTVELPADIRVSLEIFADSDMNQVIDVEHDIFIPKKEGEVLTFTLSCPTFERWMERAVMDTVEQVKAELDGYLIVRG